MRWSFKTRNNITHSIATTIRSEIIPRDEDGMLRNPSDILWKQVILMMIMMIMMMTQVMHYDLELACKEEESLEGFLRRRLHQLQLPLQLVVITMMAITVMTNMSQQVDLWATIERAEAFLHGSLYQVDTLIIPVILI